MLEFQENNIVINNNKDESAINCLLWQVFTITCFIANFLEELF
jgi:hypothetical protein